MKRLLPLAACAAMLAVPMSVAAQTASADPALDAFQKVCWASGGDYMASLKAADADGWTDTAVTGEDAGGPVSVTDKAAKAKFANGANLTLLVSRGLQNLKDIGQVKVVTCKLAVSKADAGLVNESKAWLGTPDNPADPTLAVYYEKMAPGAPAHVSKDGLAGAISGGGLAIVKFQQDSDGGILVYTAYSK